VHDLADPTLNLRQCKQDPRRSRQYSQLQAAISEGQAKPFKIQCMISLVQARISQIQTRPCEVPDNIFQLQSAIPESAVAISEIQDEIGKILHAVRLVLKSQGDRRLWLDLSSRFRANCGVQGRFALS